MSLTDYHCYFVTTTCYEFLPLLEDIRAKEIIQSSLVFCNNKYEAKIVAYVLMRNHIHLILYFQNKVDLIGYMRDFKKYTSPLLRNNWILNPKNSIESLRYNCGRQKFKVWQDRFDDLVLYSRKVIMNKFNYIHANPVKAGICSRARDFPYSSSRYYETGEMGFLDVMHVEEIL